MREYSGAYWSAPEYGARVAAPGRVRGVDGKSYPNGEQGQRLTARIALALRDQGWQQTRIAQYLGVSQPTVSRLLRDWVEA